MTIECYRTAHCAMGKLRVDRNFLESVDIIGFTVFFEKIHIYTSQMYLTSLMRVYANRYKSAQGLTEQTICLSYEALVLD